MHAFQEVVFGIKISGSTNGYPEDLKRAIAFVDAQAERLKKGSPAGIGKEQILALLAVGIADDLLQLQTRVKEADSRLAALLERIDELGLSVENKTLGGS